MKQQAIRQPQRREAPQQPRGSEQRTESAIVNEARWPTEQVPVWVLIPLRLFLGVTFVYAGLQKLTDPHFFHPGTADYIGRQIAAFAAGSPIRGLLLTVAEPHAVFFGTLIAYGELAIGLGTLAGLLLRPAAFFGALLSLLFFLSASWRVYPYFYGADIVFVFGWLTLLLAGPLGAGWQTLDARFGPDVLQRIPPELRQRLLPALAVIVGIPIERSQARLIPSNSQQSRARQGNVAARGRGYGRAQSTRRDFLRGLTIGGAGMLGLAWLWSLLHPAATTTVPTSTQSSAASSATTTGGTTSASGSAIAQASQVPTNSSTSFTIPSNGDPGVLVHLNNGKFVAFDATCTHQGCGVQYDPSSQLLLCPCHGAAFDPSQGAAVVQGPAPTPLASVSIQEDSSGTITLTS